MNKKILVIAFSFLSFGFLMLAVYNKFFRDEVFKKELVVNKKNNTTIKLNKKKLSVGKVKIGSPAQIKFSVYNVGLENLEIDRVEVSCSCSSTIVNKKKTIPGDSITITVTYNKKIPGYFYSDVLVYGNFPQSPAILGFDGMLLK